MKLGSVICLVLGCSVLCDAEYLSLARRIDVDLSLKGDDSWVYVVSSEKRRLIIEGLKTFTNGVGKAEIVGKLGSPDEEMTPSSKAAECVQGKSMLSYYLKRGNSRLPNTRDWTLSFVLDNAGALERAMYMKNGRLEVFRGDNHGANCMHAESGNGSTNTTNLCRHVITNGIDLIVTPSPTTVSATGLR